MAVSSDASLGRQLPIAVADGLGEASIPDAVLHLVGDRCEWASPSSLAALGWDPRALIGKRRQDLVHPDDLARIAAAVAKTDREQQWVTPRLHYRFRHPTSDWQRVSAIAHRIDCFGNNSPTWALVVRPDPHESDYEAGDLRFSTGT